MQPQLVSCRGGQAGGEVVWVKLEPELEDLGSLKAMRTKLDGWKQRKGHLRAAMSAMKAKRPGVNALLAVGMVLLMGASILRLNLRDVSSRLGNESSARLLGTINEDYFFQCDRSQFRTDVCNLRGDIRLESHNKTTKAFVLYTPDTLDSHNKPRKETLKPYTRKWEEGSMSTVNDVTLASQIASFPRRAKCDVHHAVPGIVFSTGGYTGNLYHEFNDGLIPLWICTQHLHQEVVLIISTFHKWWYTKYREVLEQMTNYEIINLEDSDKRVHCFPEIQAGLHIHGELAVIPDRMPGEETIRGFRDLLNRAYNTPGSNNKQQQQIRSNPNHRKPRLTIILRTQTRKFLNLEKIVELAQGLGFQVSLLNPAPTTELKKIFWLLNKTDVLLGVHGAAMTHFLFMRPGTVFVQVVPLGTDWAADEYYGEPARKLGLRYVAYKLDPEESSLSDKYNATDPVLVHPESITQQGWESVKRVYLEGQDVRPSLRRMSDVLAKAKAAVHGQV